MVSRARFLGWEPATTSAPDSNNPANPVILRTPNAPAKGKGVATQVVPRFDLLLPGEPVYFDAELQEYSVDNGKTWRHRLGWAAAVNSRGEELLDTHTYYTYDATIRKKMPPARFGVTKPRLLAENGAVPAQKVEMWLKEMFKDRTVVVHGGRLDLMSFFYEKNVFANSTTIVRDTQDEWSGYNGRDQPGLAYLTEKLLGEIIQVGGEHTPVEDADATRKIDLLRHGYDRVAEARKWVAVYEKDPARSFKGKKKKGGQKGQKKLPDVNDKDEFPGLGSK